MINQPFLKMIQTKDIVWGRHETAVQIAKDFELVGY